ncbi:mitochondrial carrier domain-containing protein [Lophiotrema nucula]|uniref:Mitochondrial carrier domain-containing protein n=1 Tax=Lophiotrema nucula TaxID=690887 RepID=A0A6A5YRH6_9PLEO|nr:mitochondrial carrier domain-containing protein [Lophiotrema nucula]
MEQKSPLQYTSASIAPSKRPGGLAAERPLRPLRPLTHLLAGASGGLATAVLTSPLDVLRTRLQSDLYRPPRLARITYSGPPSIFPRLFRVSLCHISETIHIFNSIHKTEGWRGFYRGLGPSLAGVVPATAIKFYVYGNCKRLGAHVLHYKEDAVIVHTQAAIAAGLATATATNPIWLIKTRLQLDDRGITTRRYKNSWDCARQVLGQEGIRGMFRGLSASYLGTVETALHLVLYEQLKVVYNRSLRRVNAPANSAWNEVATWISTSGAAGSAKLTAVLIAYPHEVVRTRLRQAPLENGTPRYTGLWQCFRSIGKHEGMAGLYGGLTPHVVRSVPSAIITLGVYEFVLRFMGS